jgi:hypothetical protein
VASAPATPIRSATTETPGKCCGERLLGQILGAVEGSLRGHERRKPRQRARL